MAAQTSNDNGQGILLLGHNGPPPEDKHRVTILKDHTVEFPDLWLNIYVHGPSWENAAFAPLFARARCWKAQTPLTADVVVFTGGVDVDPSLYGEVPHPMTERPSPQRDQDDMNMYVTCLEHGIPMMGVCRGAQFLHVMNGGKLFQHVDGHNGDHIMWDKRRKKAITRISSVHHQMCIPDPDLGMEVLATAAKSRLRCRSATLEERGPTTLDVEAFFYRETCSFGVQGHPEYAGYNEFAKWTLEQIEELIVNNPDIERRDGYLRLKQDILAMRGIQVVKATQ